MRQAAERFAPAELIQEEHQTPSANRPAITIFDWFEVDEGDTLTPLFHLDPETRRALMDIQIPEDLDNATLVRILDDNTAISDWATAHALEEAKDMLAEMRALQRKLTADERQRVQQAHDQVDAHGDNWRDRVLSLKAHERNDWISALEVWLDDGPDTEEWVHLPDHTTGQRIAYSYFDNMPMAHLNALGVVTVEGDHPGSSYIAAELTLGPDEANQAAKELGLACRFCRPGDRINSQGEIEE
jgi:hypothetical protein